MSETVLTQKEISEWRKRMQRVKIWDTWLASRGFDKDAFKLPPVKITSTSIMIGGKEVKK